MNILEIETALNALTPNHLDASYMKIIELLLTRYTELSPASAIAFIEDNYVEGTQWVAIKSRMVALWVDTDIDAAFYWYEQNLEASNDPYNTTTHAVFSSIAKKSIDLALYYVNKLSEQDTRESAMQPLTFGLTKGSEFVKVMEYAESLDNKQIEGDIYKEWVQKDEQSFLAWYGAIEDPDYKSHVRNDVFSSYQSNNHDAAVNWLLTSSSRDKIKQDVGSILSAWEGDDLERALAWSQQQPYVETQYALLRLLENAAQRRPEFAKKHIPLLEKNSDKVDIAHTIYRKYEFESKTKARQYLAEFEHKVELEALIKRINKYMD